MPTSNISPFDFVVQFGLMKLDFEVQAFLSDDFEKLDRMANQLFDFSYNSIQHLINTDWDPTLFIKLNPEIRRVIEVVEYQLSKNNSKHRATYYCPRGCNQLSTFISDEIECAACGQKMHLDDDSYYASLAVLGHSM